MSHERIIDLFNIDYPIIQAGMVWVSGWKLAKAVSDAGALGLIGGGSMTPEILEENITKFQSNSSKPFGVNLPIFHKHTPEHIEIVVKKKVPIVFTSAGSPKLYTKKLQENGAKVVQVVSSLKFALKSQDAGVDAVVAEGFEAGGHNGWEETTTFCLLPSLRGKLDIPYIAAGGIYDGKSMLAAMILGAEGVQIGSRFAATQESAAHSSFKQKIIDAKEGDTKLMMKHLMPVRLLKNAFYKQVEELEKQGQDKQAMSQLLGRGRSRRGMFEGNIDEGELEIGQCSALIDDLPSASDLVTRIWEEYKEAKISVV